MIGKEDKFPMLGTGKEGGGIADVDGIESPELDEFESLPLFGDPTSSLLSSSFLPPRIGCDGSTIKSMGVRLG